MLISLQILVNTCLFDIVYSMFLTDQVINSRCDAITLVKLTLNHFLSVDVPNSLKVNVETTKKEDRKQNVILMHFHEFVRTYNHTEQYMVQTVPEFLR